MEKFKIYCDQPAKAALINNNANSNKFQQHHNNNHHQLQQQQQQQHYETQQQAATAVAAVAAVVAAEKIAKREPLGLRQTTEQPEAPATAAQVDKQNGLDTLEEQENDISMASLGSDFVPSIMNEDFNEPEESYADYDYESDLQIDSSTDDELETELAMAFRKHDESQLFKAASYIEDIDRHLSEIENTPSEPNYMDYQDDLDSNKRTILINWLAEVAEEYNLQTETLFISTSLVDRFLSEMAITTSNLQLLGVSAMFIASKYEEIYPPSLNQFVDVTEETYSGLQIRQMEQMILKTLDFRISFPTISFFLKRILAYNVFPKKVYDLAEYLCQLSLLVDKPFLNYFPSEIALAAVILAAHQLEAADKITDELNHSFSQSNMKQLRLQSKTNKKATPIPFCIEALRNIHDQVYNRSINVDGGLAVVAKYSRSSHNNVALLAPLPVENLAACFK